MEWFSPKGVSIPLPPEGGSFLETFDETAASNYSGETGNAYKIRAYKTESGKYVLEYAYITCWQGCNDEFIVEIHETLESLLESKLLASRKLEKKWLVEELELEPEEI